MKTLKKLIISSLVDLGFGVYLEILYRYLAGKTPKS